MRVLIPKKYPSQSSLVLDKNSTGHTEEDLQDLDNGENIETQNGPVQQQFLNHTELCFPQFLRKEETGNQY